MSRIYTHSITAGLFGCGALAWALAAQPLVKDKELATPLNPMGINGSPYGEVFAMAMQETIDTFYHGTDKVGGHHSHEDGSTCADCEPAEKKPEEKNVGLSRRWQNFMASLDEAETTRTNPKAATKAHKFYLRRQVEDKLRFAYKLDPSHYGNYNSLHFFLTEPQMGTRPELTPSAEKLARETIDYCLKQENDPRPMLTAAGACTNVIQLMFNDRVNPEPKFTTAQMRQYLVMLDYCIARYVELAKKWDEDKSWDLLSPARIAECDERFEFIKKIRDAAEGAIIRFETGAAPKVTK